MAYDELLGTRDELSARRAFWDAAGGRESYPFHNLEKGVCGYITRAVWGGPDRRPKDWDPDEKSLAWYEFGVELISEVKEPRDEAELRQLLSTHGAHPGFVLTEWPDELRYGFVCRDAAAGRSIAVRMRTEFFMSLGKDLQQRLRETLAFGPWDVPASDRLTAQREAVANLPRKQA